MSYFMRCVQRYTAYRLTGVVIGRIGLIGVLLLLAGWGLLRAEIITVNMDWWGSVWKELQRLQHGYWATPLLWRLHSSLVLYWF